MKKSHILAALALAFALGVVAPVAGLANNASAYSDENGTATLSDVNNGIAYIENNAQYKAYGEIKEALRVYNANKTKYADITANASGVATVAQTILTAMGTANTNTAGYGYNISKTTTDIEAEDIYLDQISLAISKAQTSNLYNAYAKVISILNDDKATDAQLRAAVTTVRTTLGWSEGSTIKEGLGILTKDDYNALHPNEATLLAYRASVPANWTGYSDAVAIYNAINAANEAVAKFNAGYKLFMPLLSNSGLLTEAGKNYLRDNINIQPQDYANLATSYIANDSQWAALQTAVDNAKNTRRQAESGDNYTILGNLAQAWKNDAGDESALKTIMARMANYVAPVTGTGDDQNNDDINVRPGNTGVVAGAEGTASTTVSIVAGLATALTALGAGVIVYRNARRSSEN